MPEKETTIEALQAANVAQLEEEEDYSDLSLDDLMGDSGIELNENRPIDYPETLTGFAAGFPDWTILPPADIDKI